MSDRIVTCVYCGHEYPDGTPASGAEILTEHIKICKKHPMRELEQQLAAANARVAELETALKELAGGNITYPDLFAQQALKENKSSRCRYGILPSKACCNNCKELDNILYKCNQEIIKQTQRAEAAEAQCKAMETAINRYVFGNIALLDAMKAALEEKP